MNRLQKTHALTFKAGFNFENRKLNTSSNKPLILKSFSVWNQSMMLSFTPLKALYVEKSDYLAVSKPGALLYDLIPVVDGGLQWDKKKSFLMSIKHVGVLLNGRHQTLLSDSVIDQTWTFVLQSELTKLMSIQKSSDKEDITMTISYVDKTNLPDENPYKLVMTLGEYITLRELAAFSLPFLLGWHALYSPQLIENDLQHQ